MKTVVIVLLVGVLGYFSFEFLVKRDFDVLCEEYRRALIKREDQDSVQNAVELAKALHDRILTPRVRQAVRALAVANSSERYHLYYLAAKESGYPEWECPAISEFR